MLLLMLVIVDTRPCPGAPGGRALPLIREIHRVS